MDCIACLGMVEEPLAAGGSTRCHDCREANAVALLIHDGCGTRALREICDWEPLGGFEEAFYAVQSVADRALSEMQEHGGRSSS